MKSFVQEGNILPFTAPAGGVVSGNGYLIGALFAVAVRDAAAAAEFDGVVEGCVSLPKAAGAITEGAVVYWDNTAKNVTTTASGNTKIGCAYGVGGYASGDTSVKVRLNGTV